MKTIKRLLLCGAVALCASFATPAFAQHHGHGGGHGGGHFVNHSGWHGGHHGHHRWHGGTNVYFDFGYPFYAYGYPYYGYYGYPYGYYGSYYPGYYYSYGSPVYEGRVVERGGRSLVVAVQTELARAGYYHGAIDGIIGRGTRRAIRGYERTHGLRVDGRIDSRLLATMGLA
jgi:Putative peptidoglycan binding domain